MASFVFVIIIIVLAVKVKDKVEENKTNIERASKYQDNRSFYQKESQKRNNSYYTREKIASYRKQEMAHADHDNDEDSDLVQNIGYVKCPNCGAMVSKRSKTCFMCDADLQGAKSISD